MPASPRSDSTLNEFGQPVGPDLDGWTPPAWPPHVRLGGRTVNVEPLDIVAHGPALFAAFAPAEPSLWTYLPWGPFVDEAALAEMLTAVSELVGWQSYAVVVDGDPVGFCSYLRIDPRAGSIEIGGIAFSPALQRTTAATEALSLLMANAFALGYRRCEWKCDDLNAPSMRAAVRLGFGYEGTFAKATHYRGRSRDTAWFAITDDDWPTVHAAHTQWLAPENFDGAGQQRHSLESPQTPAH